MIARSGKEALEIVKGNSFDLVVLDIGMPEMDGLAALRRIRKNDPSARIIMCSALGQESTILKAIRYGARDFVVKPFKPERIVSAVKKALPG